MEGEPGFVEQDASQIRTRQKILKLTAYTSTGVIFFGYFLLD